MTNDEKIPLSRDAFFGGRVTLRQPEKGFRATSDALLLAAAIPEHSQHVLELGAGVGAASLAVMARLHDTRITAVERDDVIAALLRQNIADNDGINRITPITADAFANRPVWAGQHDVVMINPPYNDAASSLSPQQHRMDAMAAQSLAPWIKAAGLGLVAKGRMVMITRADRLDEVILGMSGLFGEMVIKPVYSAPDKPAIRVIITGRKGVDGPLTVLPPLMMRGHDQSETAEMRAISHEGAGLAMTPPGRQQARPRLPR